MRHSAERSATLRRMVIASSGEGTDPINARRNFSTRFNPRVKAFAAGKTAGRLVFSSLALQPLNVLALAIELGLIAVDLLLLSVVGVLLALQLVADQCPGA